MTEQTYTVQFLSYGHPTLELRHGLWHAFLAPRATKQHRYNGTSAPLSQTTISCYSAANGGQYGNQTHTLFYDSDISAANITTIDPLRHATQYRADAFGRLREVLEFVGDYGAWGKC